ncbi:hypothetical protein SAPIO_CDS9188 [Scedosporium apiospermum]|uniref:Uncharacterized protein n=1 Tax=Pseudallescheria apiosperma TaxID=563466 RepID=A0A084FYI5_PSEDA|nr:uncharacterized protein SAPIO_CDS9188 [Scedosporium apiospermum]KEZ40147.1 hypothetical protein SAPIO_CDS9188 [Scedosporium apiospermum]
MSSGNATSPKRLTWLITGSSSGIGLELVRQAQDNGHFVIATSRNPSRTPELVSEVESKGGRWIRLDVDDSECANVIHDLERDGYAIDVLVNNAGFSIHGAAESFTEAEVRAQMETLYFGPYRLTRAAVPYMRKRRSGMVTQISTGAALEGRPSMGIYAASKAALEAVSKVLAKEVAEFNVRVLVVQLGSFNTSMPSASRRSEFDAEYSGTMVDKITSMVSVDGTLKAVNDKVKGARAIYEVIVGEGVGKGLESEFLFPLGQDTLSFQNLAVDPTEEGGLEIES